jgi:hypothetical protein
MNDSLMHIAADLARARCFVSARDFASHFAGEPVIDPPVWVGVERRAGVSDRRTVHHERRWEASRGRRFNLRDRRRA